MSGEHPIIAYFGETNAARYPLILAIGREPNTNQAIKNVVGPYDFRTSPRCGFWNTSYGMLARVVDLETRSLKKLCVERRGSPLIYADSLPCGLKHRVTDKQTHRGQVAAEDAVAHITNIFSHRGLIDRVQLVVMSGIRGSLFRPAREEIKRRCELTAIPAIDLPFFYGTNAKKIQRELTEADRGLIKSIFEQFVTA